MTWLGILITAALIAIAAAYVMDAARPSMTPPKAPASPVKAGCAVLICHRRAEGGSRETLAAEWAPARARLVGTQREAIGFDAYMQFHQVSRLNLLYNVIRLSRSWPVTAFFSLLHGLPVPRPGFSDARHAAEDWDVIEVFAFSGLDAAQGFLGEEGAADARAALEDDAASWIRRRQVVPMQVTRAYPGEPGAELSAYTIYCLRARPHLGRAGMIDYWLHEHRRYVLRLQPVLRFGAYDQLVARETEELAESAALISSADAEPWDGVAMLGYGAMGEIWRGLANPRVQMANIGLVSDETRFIDAGRSSLMLGRVLHRL